MGMGRRLALLGALLVAIGAPVWSYPRTAEPAFGLRQLREFKTSNDGRRMTLDFTHEDPHVAGRRVEVNYDVEMAPHIRPRNTDDEEHLVSVLGNANATMRLTFDSTEAAAAFAADLAQGDLLHGHYQDGPGEEAHVYPYHARVLATKLEQETLAIDIDIPTLTEVFMNAKACIVVALAPEDHYLVHGDPGVQEAAPQDEEEPPTIPPERVRQLDVTHRQLGALDWAKRWTERGLQHIAKLGDMVMDVVEIAVKLVNFIFTGDLAGDMNQAINLFDFNYDKATGSPICGFNMEDNIPPVKTTKPPFWGECRRCYAYSTVALRFEVDISKYVVNKVVAMVDGNLDFNLLMDEFLVPSVGYNGTMKKLIKSIGTNGITVTLGSIPVNIGAQVPVSMGVDMWVNGAATFGVDMTASAKFKAGYRYIRTASPQEQMVNKVENPNFGGKGVRLLRWAGREVGLRLFIFPVVQLNLALGVGALKELAHIGGPNFGLEASVAAIVTASNSSVAVVERSLGVEGTIGANITLKLGSDKSKDLLGGKAVVKPKGIYSKTFPLGSDTVRFVPFRIPRRLVGTEEDLAAMDYSIAGVDDDVDDDVINQMDSVAAMADSVAEEDAFSIEAPEPEAPTPSFPPGSLPEYDWSRTGTTYTGTLERLKSEYVVGCSNEDLKGVVPPYLEATAIVINRSDNFNFFLDLALTFSYGNTEPGTSGLGAFAAINQGVSRLTFWGPLPRTVQTRCDAVPPPVNGIFTDVNYMYPTVMYNANTTTERITLPTLAGGICNNGDKIVLGDTKGCLRIILDRIGRNTSTTSARRRALDALSNEERRRELGHMDRFPRILQQCAPLKPPTPAPTRLPTSPPPPTMAPTRSPSNAPTRTPTTAPSTAPTRGPTTALTNAPTTVLTEPPSAARAESTSPNNSATAAIGAPSPAPSLATSEPTKAPSPGPEDSFDTMFITEPEPIEDAQPSPVDGELAVDYNDNGAGGAGSEIITAPTHGDENTFGSWETSAVETVSSVDHTMPPTEQESVDDDIEDQYVPSPTVAKQDEADARASKLPSWLPLAVGFGVMLLTIVGLIRWARKKWQAFTRQITDWRTGQAERAAQANPV